MQNFSCQQFKFLSHPVPGYAADHGPLSAEEERGHGLQRSEKCDMAFQPARSDPWFAKMGGSHLEPRRRATGVGEVDGMLEDLPTDLRADNAPCSARKGTAVR